MGFLQEFKEFAIKGNMVDMAVGLVIGASFGKIVSSLVSDVMMPPLGLITGGINFSDMKLVLKSATTMPNGKALEAITLNYGNFIQAAFDFLIIALSVFLMIQFMNRLRTPKVPPVEPVSEATREEVLLTEIRDLLKNRA